MSEQICGGKSCFNPECFCDEYQERILELIIHRPDLDYMQIALLTGSNITAVTKIAKENNCQRKRGRKSSPTTEGQNMNSEVEGQ